MIDRLTIERIKDRADIVDVVSEFVSLKKVGVNYRGLCPFHNDHTPSFYVSPTRRTCHCFVCGEGGDSVGFIMKHEQLTYPDALRWLANRYHIQIEERELTEQQKKEQSDREAMFIVNEWAAKYFKNILHNDIDGRAIGMQYFRQRGVRDDIIEKFQLGFCLSDRHAMSDAALKEGYQKEYLMKTGLAYESDKKGDLIDRFAGRVMFPWIGVSGKVVAFGGRVLDSRTKGVSQKYVNSPDSDIYHKDHELYGIFQAKKAIAKENCVYMVEGYTDVISMHQCGIENVVANSGTALSEHQIHLLHRFTQNIVLLYDGDEAGIKAALRGTDMLLKEGMNVKVMLLPDGDDPDSFARKHTADEFRQYIKEHQTDFIEFKTKVLLKDATDPRVRSEAISSIIESISVIGDPIVRATYIQDCAVRLGYSEQTLTAKMNENIRGMRANQRRQTTDQPAAPASEAQENQVETQPKEEEKKQEINVNTLSSLIIKMVIKHGGIVIFDNVETEDGDTISFTLAEWIDYNLKQDGLQFAESIYNQILKEAVEHSKDENFDSEKYFTLHPDYDISSISIKLCADNVILSKSLQMEVTPYILREQAEHLLLDFLNEYLMQRINQLTTEIKQAGDDMDKQMTLIGELQNVQKMRMQISQKTGTSVITRRV
ncbi:MAG: DNA primase [Prevotella sp.]|nr:DNA primase [Prevotella sp.]MBO6233834.1 DNA primase [Prevotella sp.]MBR2253309.1 DNA primase [Prevotella sp.]